MVKVEYSLKERDRKRYIKDRIARFTFISGGISVLATILLIFFYLVTAVLPIFSNANIEMLDEYSYPHQQAIVGLGMGNYGENSFLFDRSGLLSYIGFENGKAKKLSSTQIIDEPTVFAAGSQDQGWYAYGNQTGEVVAVKPNFIVSFTKDGHILTPNMSAFNRGKPIVVDQQRRPIKQLAISVTDTQAIFVAVSTDGAINAQLAKSIDENIYGEVTQSSEYQFIPLSLPTFTADIDKLLLSPDGSQLFVLSGNNLILADLAVVDSLSNSPVRDSNGQSQQKLTAGYTVREVVDLSQMLAEKRVEDISLLAGASSLLVRHQDNSVSQWFDVLKNEHRLLTKIREFTLAEDSRFIVTNAYSKGFYSFHQNGQLQSYFTTSESQIFSSQLYSQMPSVAAVSSNGNYLVAVNDEQLIVHQVENMHPEISFSSLWQQVWYENYPNPKYVWQSTSASDDFEAKFSLIPLTFGTLKATAYAMLFSIPLAIGGAIYTAYFMSAPIRRKVKPTIEIMEAMPTVIIGFIAGLWLAPLVESHLPAVIALFVLLPVVAMLIGGGWSILPSSIVRPIPSGWHGMVLIPIFLVFGYGVFSLSAEIESGLFGGDIRLFLSSHGFDYDQRNALVVGLAMGFAVIPTVFTIAEDAIYSVPTHLSEGALALGATRWQTLIFVVLQTASPGIFSAVMIGLGRAVGETMIILMATGNTPIMDFSIFEGMRTLAATIAVEMPESEVGDTHYRLLFLSALILFLFTFAVNSLAEIVRQRLKDKYSSM